MINQSKTDLALFIDAFGCNAKNIKPGRAMFKAKDLDRQVASAKNLIAHRDFNLRVVNDADMASYNAFEVWEGK